MSEERRTPASPAAQRELLTTFITAARSGDMAALEQLLAKNATNIADGNGRVRVARRTVVGAERVAKYLSALAWFWENVEVRLVTTNGQTSAVLRQDGEVYGLITVSASNEGIDQVLWMVNLEKVKAVPAPA
ncbi:hypothetical protein [Micromonospora sp. NPDC005367]|uniref:hypothetical protein n=1 Tax=Micromonospora sp. NPDC005367 TaxID=3155590 RepID=UPI0033AF5BF4